MAKVIVFDVKDPSALNDVMSCVCFNVSLSVYMVKGVWVWMKQNQPIVEAGRWISGAFLYYSFYFKKHV